MNNIIKINGYEIKCTYAGIDQYTVYKNGKDLGTCWSIGALANMVGVNAETVNEEMWNQR